MGRPLNTLNSPMYGSTGKATDQIQITANVDGASAACYIVKQTSPTKFLVSKAATNATATATMSSGSVASVAVTLAGSGYSRIPNIALSSEPTAGGRKAVLQAKMKATAVVVAEGGIGYSVGNILQFAAGVYLTPVKVTVATIGSKGEVLTVTLTSGGTGYSTPLPTTNIETYNLATVNTGFGAKFNATFGVDTITVVDGGTQYVGTPTVLIDGIMGVVTLTDTGAPTLGQGAITLTKFGGSTVRVRSLKKDTATGFDGVQYDIEYVAGTFVAATKRAVTDTVSLYAGGTGYAIFDLLTLVGGTFSTALTIQVMTVSSTGAVTSFKVTNEGTYTVLPVTSSNVATTGGSGSAATLNVGTFDFKEASADIQTA